MVSNEDIHQVINVIKEIRTIKKGSDTQFILEHKNNTTTINIDLNLIDEIIKTMLEKLLILDKLSKKGLSYYVMELINEYNENNTDNPNNVEMTDVDNSQEHASNNTLFVTRILHILTKNLTLNFLRKIQIMK